MSALLINLCPAWCMWVPHRCDPNAIWAPCAGNDGDADDGIGDEAMPLWDTCLPLGAAVIGVTIVLVVACAWAWWLIANRSNNMPHMTPNNNHDVDDDGHIVIITLTPSAANSNCVTIVAWLTCDQHHIGDLYHIISALSMPTAPYSTFGSQFGSIPHIRFISIGIYLHISIYMNDNEWRRDNDMI